MAEDLLKDYKPQLLKEPTPINYLHFLESYLGANLEFMDIYYEYKPIWGATAFNDDEYLEVFDRENCRIDVRKLMNRTIVIDNYVMQEGKEGLALFTGLHEGGHLWLHPGVFVKPDYGGQIIPLAKEILKSEGISGDRVVTGLDFQHDWFAESEFPNRISEAYGVSKQAAFIKLRKFGFIVAEREIELTMF